MTKIITTIGPASESEEVLKYFYNHSVEIARLNFSHNTPEWHIATGEKARKIGLQLMVDLAGPKVLIGDLQAPTNIETGTSVIIEFQKSGLSYPYTETIKEVEYQVLPSYLEFSEFVKTSDIILIDDGKLTLTCQENQNGRLFCNVEFGGVVKTHKGINLPSSDLKIDFLVERDREFLTKVLPVLKPEYVAPSFVKTLADLEILEKFIQEILKSNKIIGYFPKICTKLEMQEAVKDENLSQIVAKSDLIMIARGDLALETQPLHIEVPFLQEKIKQECLKQNKPFVVATQILESMFSSPVPLRSEISDLYRAVKVDKANYVMLSGESAAGNFSTKCVDLMHNMITHY